MKQLELIKQNAKLDWVDDVDGVIERVDWLQEGDFRWLIKQAEQLEKIKNLSDTEEIVTLADFAKETLRIIEDREMPTRKSRF